MLKQDKTTIRLTVRVPETLDKLIRNEADMYGASINHIMKKIISDYFSDNEIGPLTDS